MFKFYTGGIAKYSGGSVHYFPNYHSIKNTVEVKRFESTLTRYLTRKIGFEAVMRIRCTRGMLLFVSVHVGCKWMFYLKRWIFFLIITSNAVYRSDCNII